MNDLRKYLERSGGASARRVVKWDHYLEAYDRHLSRFRGTEVHVVEVGVAHGGSLRMWKDYFGPQARIYGVDINPHCQALEEDRVRILIGDQGDRDFLGRLVRDVPRIDVFIDDGGHFMEQQISTFEVVYPRVSPHGVYICEDLHTSYWRKGYNGGLRRRGTFIEYSKRLIDVLNEWHYRSGGASPLGRATHSLHFYDSMLVVEKSPMSEPHLIEVGEQTVIDYQPPLPLARKIKNKIRSLLP